MKSAVTVSLVDQARGGPFVLWDDLAAACATAAELGFDAVEVFSPGADSVDPGQLAALLNQHGLQLAAVGTGAGMVLHGLSLISDDAQQRTQALKFVKDLIDLGGPLGAPAIIGSMQGRWGPDLPRTAALQRLGEALTELGSYAGRHGVPLIYEPLNRYETNLCCTLAEGAALCESIPGEQVKLLADLFHMNIEEADLAEAIRASGQAIGHVHFVDSNRRPAGCGHTDFPPIIAALREVGYQGYLSAEAFAYPDSRQAAELTIASYRRLMGS